MPPPPPALPAGRLVSLDAFRGLIMLTLLFGGVFQSLKDYNSVSTLGGKVVWDWRWLPEQNGHVAWEGCVYWDLIQPSFMFIVGVAMPISMANRYAAHTPRLLQFLRVLSRAAKLILLGVILDNFGAKEWNFGFIRVLQQIAIGYVLAFFVVGRGFLVQGIAAAVILIGYNIFWMYNGHNGPGGPWAKEGINIGTFVDDKVLSVWDRILLSWREGSLSAGINTHIPGRNYSGNYVMLNAIPATATMIFGVMAGTLLQSKRPPQRIALILLIAGVIGVALGALLGIWFPLIKKIWTPSFAIYSSGLVAILLAVFYWLIDVVKWKGWAFPLVVVGMNSIAAYCMGGLFGGWFRSLTGTWISPLELELGKVWFPVFQRCLFAICAWCVLYWLYRRRIFFRL